jgi:hypothetical protein
MGKKRSKKDGTQKNYQTSSLYKVEFLGNSFQLSLKLAARWIQFLTTLIKNCTQAYCFFTSSHGVYSSWKKV